VSDVIEIEERFLLDPPVSVTLYRDRGQWWFHVPALRCSGGGCDTQDEARRAARRAAAFALGAKA